MSERDEVLRWLVDSLLNDAGKTVTVGAWAAWRDRYERTILGWHQPILMCACQQWLTCDHPWPAILHSPHAPEVPTHLLVAEPHP